MGRVARVVLDNSIVPALLFLVTYIVARMLLEQRLGAPLAIAVALLPVPFFGLWLLAMVRGIRQMDELERRIQLEAVAVGFPLALLLLMTLGLLELAITLSPDDWSYRHVWAFLPIFYLVGLALARRRYQ